MDYALVTFEHESFGTMDIKISRKISCKKIIFNLFDAISKPVPYNLSFYIKANRSDKLLFPNNTLEDFQIYDGELLKLL